MNSKKYSTSYALILMVLSSLSFTLMVVLIRMAGEAEPGAFGSLEAVLVRSAPMAIFCLVWMQKDKQLHFSQLSFKQKKWLLVRGFIGATSMWCLFYASLHIPLAMASLFSNTSVFFVALLAHFFLGERLTKSGIIMVLGGFLGVALILWDDLANHPQPTTDWFAYAIGIMAGFLSAVAYFSVRKLKFAAPSAIIFSLALAGIIIPLAAQLVGWALHFPKTSKAWMLLVASSFPAIIGQLCMTESLRKGPSALVSTGQYMGPVFAALLGIWFFAEHLTWQKVLGGTAVICFGVAFPVLQHFATSFAKRSRA